MRPARVRRHPLGDPPAQAPRRRRRRRVPLLRPGGVVGEDGGGGGERAGRRAGEAGGGERHGGRERVAGDDGDAREAGGLLLLRGRRGCPRLGVRPEGEGSSRSERIRRSDEARRRGPDGRPEAGGDEQALGRDAGDRARHHDARVGRRCYARGIFRQEEPNPLVCGWEGGIAGRCGASAESDDGTGSQYGHRRWICGCAASGCCHAIWDGRGH
mmetsp:Transcript_11000/g.25896  ORF Transcript_11000/g.25896 Transcript_11000/m.25896 type:complete len:214 (-) Transcript_11000:294-935(-)